MGTILKQGISGISYVSGFVHTCVGNRHKYVQGVGVGVSVSVRFQREGQPCSFALCHWVPSWLAGCWKKSNVLCGGLVMM